MTTKTREQLVAMALDELYVTGTGQAPDDDDEDKVDSRFDGLMAELALREVVQVDNEDAIPVEWCGALAELLANECAAAFGRPKKSEADRTAIEDRLKVMVQRVQASNRKLRTDVPVQSRGAYSLNAWRTGQ